MRRALRLRSTIVALVVAFVTGVGLCFSPLLGAPGIESALILSVVLAPFCAAIGVRVVERHRREGGATDAAELIADGMAGSLFVLAVPIAAISLNTLRVPVCALLEGVGFLVLGPVISVVLATSVGIVTSVFVRRPRLATTIAVLVPIAAIGIAIAGFYATPAIYAYGHFLGYFPGTLYDPDITLTATYASFRAVSVAWILGLWALISAVWDPAFLEARPRVLWRRWRMALAAMLMLGGAIACETLATDLGHRSTAESIAEELGGRLRGERCVVVYPREMPRQNAVRLAADCAFRVQQSERTLGVRQPRTITAFFFRDADEKRRLMGASNTYVAKPWRDEVYLQVDEWPHPVLFHEIVHVVAGNVGRGPFRVGATTGGLVPAPAVIEGMAVAVAWDGRDGLTPHQWARAMLELDLAPPLESVDGLSFLLQPASRAYTASGSFVRWILETEGSDALRTLYMTGDFEEALGRPLRSAERDWHRFLREEVELPDEARALAQLRFERPGIFGQICPHRIANLRQELAGDLGAGDDRAAVRTCRSILTLDRGQAGTRAILVGAFARLGREERARGELQRLVGPPSAAPPIVAAARLELADASWVRGRRSEAARIYAELQTRPMAEDERRQIAVRVLAMEMGGAGERALRGLLVPRRDVTQDAGLTMFHIAELERVRGDGLAAYLEGRQLAFRERFELALPRLVEARQRGLPHELLTREARRLEAIARYGVGDYTGASELFVEIARDRTSNEADRIESRDWLTRIRLR